MVHISLPTLEPSVVERTYRGTVTDEGALIELSSELGTAELRVDHDGFVIDHSVQATRVTPQPAG